MTAIKEGSILYIGLNHNINETGSLRKPLTLFLGTEVLFSLYGYNGNIYRQLALDLYNQIKAANSGAKRITLRYFSDVKKEIEDFFTSAELIVDGKQYPFDTVAMKAIINGCSTSGDVKVKNPISIMRSSIPMVLLKMIERAIMKTLITGIISKVCLQTHSSMIA